MPFPPPPERPGNNANSYNSLGCIPSPFKVHVGEEKQKMGKAMVETSLDIWRCETSNLGFSYTAYPEDRPKCTFPCTCVSLSAFTKFMRNGLWDTLEGDSVPYDVLYHWPYHIFLRDSYHPGYLRRIIFACVYSPYHSQPVHIIVRKHYLAIRPREINVRKRRVAMTPWEIPWSHESHSQIVKIERSGLVK